MLDLLVRSLADTHAVAGALAGVIRRGDIVVLGGEMGAGKTAFAQGFANALGVSEPVTSPTFTLVHSYTSGRMPMHHADIYRLATIHEVDDLGLSELVDESGVLLVEWGDVASPVFGAHLEVVLTAIDDDEDARHIALRDVGGRWATRWNQLVQTLSPWGAPC